MNLVVALVPCLRNSLKERERERERERDTFTNFVQYSLPRWTDGHDNVVVMAFKLCVFFFVYSLGWHCYGFQVSNEQTDQTTEKNWLITDFVKLS